MFFHHFISHIFNEISKRFAKEYCEIKICTFLGLIFTKHIMVQEQEKKKKIIEIQR